MIEKYYKNVNGQYVISGYGNNKPVIINISAKITLEQNSKERGVQWIYLMKLIEGQGLRKRRQAKEAGVVEVCGEHPGDTQCSWRGTAAVVSGGRDWRREQEHWTRASLWLRKAAPRPFSLEFVKITEVIHGSDYVL